MIPRELYQLRPSRWFADLVIDWAIIIACFCLFSISKPWILLPVFALIIGARQHALALLGHDATHKLVFPKALRAADFISELLIASPILISMDEGYRPWHFAHHKNLGTEEDPELSYRGKPPYHPKPTPGRIVRFYLTDFLGFGLMDILRFQIAIFPTKKLRSLILPITLWSAFILICWRLDALWIVALWTVSLLTGFWAAFRIRTWSEHVGAKLDGRGSSHRFKAGLIPRFLFFPHHTYCHFEHHLYPQVPYYHLPALRAHLIRYAHLPALRLQLTGRTELQTVRELFDNFASK